MLLTKEYLQTNHFLVKQQRNHNKPMFENYVLTKLNQKLQYCVTSNKF